MNNSGAFSFAMLAHMLGERDVSAANKERLSEEAKERNEPLMRTRKEIPS